MNKRWLNRHLYGYVGVLLAATAIAVVAGWTGFASRIDNYGYDFLFSINPRPDAQPQSDAA